MVTKDQTRLELATERFSQKEKRLRAILKEYRTIDRRIDYLSKQASGDDLPFEPNITVQAQKQDMMSALMYTQHGKLSEEETEIASAVEQYVQVEGYASRYRVARKLQNAFSDNKEEDKRLQLAYNLLGQDEEERVELTETERLAILREPYIERAKHELLILITKRDAIKYALDTMHDYYHDDYLLIWHRDVQNEPVETVCRIVNLTYPEGLENYKKRIRRSREEFARWIPEHLLQ